MCRASFLRYPDSMDSVLADLQFTYEKTQSERWWHASSHSCYHTAQWLKGRITLVGPSERLQWFGKGRAPWHDASFLWDPVCPRGNWEQGGSLRLALPIRWSFRNFLGACLSSPVFLPKLLSVEINICFIWNHFPICPSFTSQDVIFLLFLITHVGRLNRQCFPFQDNERC